MKKSLSLFSLALLFSNLHAGRIHLTDGTVTYVSDHIIIKNDMG